MTGRPNFDLRCSGCGKEFPFGTYVCPDGDGVLQAEYDLPKEVTREELRDRSIRGIWQFSRFLPNFPVTTCGEGNTPTLPSKTMGKELGIDLYFKDEGRNPTGSFKDRAAAVLLSAERELGHSECATATSGNAGGALALYSRIAGLVCYIFVYEPTREKYLHMKSFGLPMLVVESEVESAMTFLTEEACEKFDWARLTTMASANPFNIEGYKTLAYEIVADGYNPDVVVSPMGSGTLVLGICKGFRELLDMNLISTAPRVVGVQPAQVNPIAHAYENNLTFVEPVSSGKTMASGLVMDNPGICGAEALRAVLATSGGVVSVTEEEILSTTMALPIQEGLFAEPSGAASVAGVRVARDRGMISEGEQVICVNSASGFKDLSVFGEDREAKNVHRIPPKIEAVAEVLQRQAS